VWGGGTRGGGLRGGGGGGDWCAPPGTGRKGGGGVPSRVCRGKGNKTTLSHTKLELQKTRVSQCPPDGAEEDDWEGKNLFENPLHRSTP